MKRVLISILAVLTFVCANAQDNSHRIGLGAGVMYRNGVDATLLWEHELKYHNSYEIFCNAFLRWDKCPDCNAVCSDSFWNTYNIVSLGAMYKPCVIRLRNSYGSLRVGASIGINQKTDLLAGIHFGYEQNYALGSGIMFYWQAKVDLTLPKKDDLVKAGFALGFKFPVYNKSRH